MWRGVRNRTEVFRVFTAFSITALLATVAGTLLTRNASGAGELPGVWSDPVKICDGDLVYFTDVWGDTIYKSGRPNITIGSGWGTEWESKSAMWGFGPLNGWSRIEVVDYVIYRVFHYGGNYSLDHLGFNKSADNGTTWSPTIDLGMTGDNDGYCGIYYLNSTLFIYTDENNTIKLIRSADLGGTWSSPVNITPVNWGDPLPSDLIFLDGVMYLSYLNETSPDVYHVFVISSRDGGHTWGDRVLIGDGAMPLLREDSGELYLSYMGASPGWTDVGVRFSRSADGQTWTTPVVVGPMKDTIDVSALHDIAVEDGKIACAWLDYNLTYGTYNLRINYSDDGGDAWYDLGDVVGTGNNSQLPSLLFGGGMLHLWFEDMAGSSDWWRDFPIFYRQLTLFAGPVPEFTSMIVPAVGVMAIAAVLSITRGRRPPIKT